MKMRRCFGIIAGCVLCWAALAAAEPQEKTHLTFQQDGSDLIVSTVLTINNSPHALATGMYELDGKVVLTYVVAQNSDLLVRSQKDIKVTWRLPNLQKGDLKFTVSGQQVLLNTSGLKGLNSGLSTVVEAGEKWLKTVEKLNKK